MNCYQDVGFKKPKLKHSIKKKRCSLSKLMWRTFSLQNATNLLAPRRKYGHWQAHSKSYPSLLYLWDQKSKIQAHSHRSSCHQPVILVHVYTPGNNIIANQRYFGEIKQAASTKTSINPDRAMPALLIRLQIPKKPSTPNPPTLIPAHHRLGRCSCGKAWIRSPLQHPHPPTLPNPSPSRSPQPRSAVQRPPPPMPPPRPTLSTESAQPAIYISPPSSPENPFSSESPSCPSKDPFVDDTKQIEDWKSSVSLNSPDAPPPIPARPYPSCLLADTSSGSSSGLEDGFQSPLGVRTSIPESGTANRWPPIAEGLPFTDLFSKGHVRPASVCTQDLIRPRSESDSDGVCTLSDGITAFDVSDLLWFALEKGELQAVDTVTGEIVDLRVGVHSSNVLHMLRSKDQLWTLDDGGGLRIWEPEPGFHGFSLQSRPVSRRVSVRETSATLQDGRLWTAARRGIETYFPDAESSGDVFHRKADVGSLGNISRVNGIEKRRVIQAGGYHRITSVIVVGNRYCWAGNLTGKIQVFDILPPTNPTWSVLKEFKAYRSVSVQDMVQTTSELNQSEIRVLSLSDQGQIRMWDAQLNRDLVAEWFLCQENEVRARQSQFCSYRAFKVLICSWNIDSNKQADLDAEDPDFLQNWVTDFGSGEVPDLIVIGMQEIVDLESVNAIIILERCIEKGCQIADLYAVQAVAEQTDGDRSLHFGSRADYNLVEGWQLVGLFQFVMVRTDNKFTVREVPCEMTKTGLKGYHGNKGAIATRLIIEDSSFCFVKPSCGTPEGDQLAEQRHGDYYEGHEFPECPDQTDGVFVNGGDGSMILDHENVIWSGDLNYRIDLPREQVIAAMNQRNWDVLIRYDQLLVQRATISLFALKIFQEVPTIIVGVTAPVNNDRYPQERITMTPAKSKGLQRGVIG
ncbi:hypothetical protein BJ742DRAFT_865624 [Cladochytrium replicatum]|nr:hypothetical protein BJ742DRAFT_865624 [Cladochytrium replicatum]